jgi:acetylornithine deacetylase
MKPANDPVDILAMLVTHRTDAAHGDERALADHLAERLRERGADDVVVEDVPRTAVSRPASYVYARFGRPRLLVNAHLDTVPPNVDWSSDPFVPRLEGGRIYALGASDTKGAIAAILAALSEQRPKDVGILFSGDEELSGVAIRSFVASPHRESIERAIVCEPTSLKAGTRHRGYLMFEVDVTGPGGHSSRADAMPAPIVMLSRVAVALDDWSRRHRTVGPPGFFGMCLNVAKLDGGIAHNVVPAHARLTVSLRPPPGADAGAIRAELEALVREVESSASVRWGAVNLPLETRDLAAFEPFIGEAARAPVDLAFWTEAAVLAANGVDAVVLGPGDIAQAHAPDEYVSIEELHRATDLFRAVFRASA